MASEQRPWKRQREDFWRSHHDAWKRSDLNQRQYCESHGLPQKAFENWRQMFRLEPERPQRKLLYRRRPIRPPLSPPASPPLSPGAYPSLATGGFPLFSGRARVIGAGSATQTSDGFSKRQLDLRQVPRRWRAGMASINVFYVDGSVN